MGVDYTGNYGIGVNIYEKEFEEDSDYASDFISYLDDILEDTNYYYFEVGHANYGGDSNDIYVCIDNPFENGYCSLEEKASDLLAFLTKNKIEYEGIVDVVGGLNVW
mgnify:FL=1